MPTDTPLLLGGDWNCVAEGLDLVGGQPGTRQHDFQSALLPFQQALSLQDAFRCLHPQARDFTNTATNNASSAIIDRWLVSDGLLPNISAASVTDLILSDHYGVAVSVSPANAPPRGPGLWSMPPAILSQPEFKARMLRWMVLGGRVGLGIVTRPLLRSASKLACLFLFLHVITGHHALGRRAYLTLLGSAI